MRLTGPAWRIVGAVGGWLLFTFLVALLVRAVMAVQVLGGSCASGGPYVISVECPRAVLIVIPAVFFLAIGVVVVGAIVQRGFGTPLLAWAWVLAFGALGVESIVAGVAGGGGILAIVIGAMFLLFSIPVLVFEYRQSPLRLFIGATNLREEGFFVRTGSLKRMFRRKPSKQDYLQTVEATPVDAVRAIALTVVSAAAGSWLGWITFDALG
jgi:hypothetical protein